MLRNINLSLATCLSWAEGASDAFESDKAAIFARDGSVLHLPAYAVLSHHKSPAKWSRRRLPYIEGSRQVLHMLSTGFFVLVVIMSSQEMKCHGRRVFNAVRV
jgi:hypothetical protein